jgi:hypothetical protein
MVTMVAVATGLVGRTLANGLLNLSGFRLLPRTLERFRTDKLMAWALEARSGHGS